MWAHFSVAVWEKNALGRLLNWASANIYTTMTINVKKGDWDVKQIQFHREAILLSFFYQLVLQEFFKEFFFIFLSLPMTFNPSLFLSHSFYHANEHVVDAGTTNVETKLTIPPTTQCWSGGNSNNSRVRRRSVFAFNHVAYPHFSIFIFDLFSFSNCCKVSKHECLSNFFI